ncbi:MAG: hypothetical protein A2Z75_06310 [Chloroflexi bacterium RBG_13_50_10]|nr:MAG: hypothetical protein A2Z75_06310 [Chloroflexi bacterium RBG_13_50_10]
MLSTDEHFKVSHILDDLRHSVGDSEFGYRAQGFLAHALMHLGWTIIDIKPQGHPDVIANLGSQALLLQAKSIHGRTRRQGFSLGQEDLEGIRPKDHNTTGYLAILDCTIPVSWLLVDYCVIRRQVAQPTHVVSLYAMGNKELSSECTEEFVKLVSSHQSHIRNLDFHILCSRALRGEPL